MSLTNPSIPDLGVSQGAANIYAQIKNGTAFVNPVAATSAAFSQLTDTLSIKSMYSSIDAAMTQMQTAGADTTNPDQYAALEQLKFGIGDIGNGTTPTKLSNGQAVGFYDMSSAGSSLADAASTVNGHAENHLANINRTLPLAQTQSQIDQDLNGASNPCEGLANVFGSLIDAGQQMFDRISTAIGQVLSFVSGAIDAIVSGIADAIAQGVAAITDLFDGSGLFDIDLGTGLSKLASALQEMVDAVSEVYNTITDEINRVIDQVTDLLDYALSNLMSSLNPCSEDLVQQIGSEDLKTELENIHSS